MVDLSSTAQALVQGERASRTLVLVSLRTQTSPYPDLPAAPGPARVRVACIVVNWNNAADTLACLRALELQTETSLGVFVVDNGSTDDSADILAAYLSSRPAEAPIRMQMLRAGANLGFSAGNNAGIRAAAALQPEFYWLLNNDTVPPPDTLHQLLQCAQADTRIGLVGSVLYYLHDPARVQAWGGGRMRATLAYATHYLAPHTFGRGDYLTFASVLVRAEVYRQVGLLDERFFMYYEDAEFCLRANKAGWGMAVAKGTAVLHKEGGSAQRPRALERTRTISALTLIALHGTHPQLGQVVFLVARVAKKLLRLRLQEIAPVLAGARDYFSGRHPASRP